MRKTIKAKIEWLSKEQGGRTIIPQGNKYSPIIRHTKPQLQPLPWLARESWSLFVENKEFVSELETIAEVWYLSEKAPDNLSENVEFELYEGAKLVATGKILGVYKDAQ